MRLSAHSHLALRPLLSFLPSLSLRPAHPQSPDTINVAVPFTADLQVSAPANEVGTAIILPLLPLHMRKLRKEGEATVGRSAPGHLDTLALGMSLFTTRLTLPLRPRRCLHWETLPLCVFMSSLQLEFTWLSHIASTGHAWDGPLHASPEQMWGKGSRSKAHQTDSLLFPAQPGPCSLSPAAR